MTHPEPRIRPAADYPLTASLNRHFEADPASSDIVEEMLANGPHRLYHFLLTDQESGESALVARRVLGAFLDPAPSNSNPRTPVANRPTAQSVLAELTTVRDELRNVLDACARREKVRLADLLRERAPIALLGDCWLDIVSQPATQPATIIGRLFAQHFANRGRGDQRLDQTHQRRHALEGYGVALPQIMAPGFLDQARAHELTTWHGAFYLALARLPASFLPELIGMHCAHHLLGIDDHLLGLPAAIPDADVVDVLEEFLDAAHTLPDGPVLVDRLHQGLRIGSAMEREHVGMLDALAERLASISLDARVADIIARHAPYAGRQHGRVTVGGQSLTDMMDQATFDPVAIMRKLRSSRQLKPMRSGEPRLLRAIKFGGPMFGIFDEAEADTFKQWANEVQAGRPADPLVPADRVGLTEAKRWLDAVRSCIPDDVRFVDPGSPGDRELFHRLVNIEQYPGTIAFARRYAEGVLARAEVLFEHGARGTYTDATSFDYSPEALLERVDRIYWDKLVNPYQPLAEIPDVDEVIFQQKTFALGSLIDGAWAHRVGNVGRFDQTSDQMLLSIYADEMGRGDLRKNHVTLIYRVLKSMSIELPHIGDPAFLEQAELPDSLYGFSIYQLALALFPDSLHDEILGYNLGIEMFGLGAMRMHEMQKLRKYGFDVCYEEAHLSIDNFSAGHARQSAEIIVAHLDAVQRVSGHLAVNRQWRRIWRGYASFAYFVEHSLLRSLEPPAPVAAIADAGDAQPVPSSEFAELTI